MELMKELDFELVAIDGIGYGHERSALELLDSRIILWGKMYWIKKNPEKALHNSENLRKKLFCILSLNSAK